MMLPAYVYVEPVQLADVVVEVGHVERSRAIELATAAVLMGEDFNVDPAWLCAVALGETPTLRPDIKDGVCQVVGDKSGTIWGSVFSAAQLYARIVAKHGRHNAHLIYGCGMDRCHGRWTSQARHKVRVWRRIKRALVVPT